MIVMLCEETGDVRPYEGKSEIIIPYTIPVKLHDEAPAIPTGAAFRYRKYTAKEVRHRYGDVTYPEAVFHVRKEWEMRRAITEKFLG